jgi:hypothetical protein
MSAAVRCCSVALPLSIAFVLAMGACAGSGAAPSAPPSTPPVPPSPRIAWSGPPVQAAFRADGGLDVVLTAPTLGHRFELEDVVVDGATVRVACKLVTPARGTLQGQMLDDLRIAVAAVRLPAAVRTANVTVATWEDGVAYFVAPEAVLAAVAVR